MIRFLDTSALVKRYVSEPGSAEVRALIRRGGIAVSRVAYAELAAAIARLAREGAITERACDAVLDRLDDDFAQFTVVELRVPIVRRARELVRSAPLRGYDAIQLASALALKEQGAPVDLWTADTTLAAAARAVGLRATVPG